MDIQKLFDKHEAYKDKGIRLTEDDLFQWIVLWEAMLDANTTLKSTYQEEKQQLDVEEGLMFIELQNEKIEVIDKKGETTYKNKYTVDSAKAVLSQKFFDRRKEQQELKLKTELLQNKTTVVGEYINIVKLTLRK